VIEMSFVDTLSKINQAAKKIYFGPQSAMTFFGRQVLADRPLVHSQGIRQLNLNKTWTDILGDLLVIIWSLRSWTPSWRPQWERVYSVLQSIPAGS